MELKRHDPEFESLHASLLDDAVRHTYWERHSTYPYGVVPRVLAQTLFALASLVYGSRPSYLKFRAIEIIARVPYQSWTAVNFTLHTLFFGDEKRALELSRRSSYAEYAQENETMHVVVISQLAEREQRAGLFRRILFPVTFAFFYYWFSFTLYLLKHRWSYELNALFEQHAYEQYDAFLKENESVLRSKTVESAFLTWYGRHPKNQYEFFEAVRNDELIHKNTSLEAIGS
jgi:hypothetical protein